MFSNIGRKIKTLAKVVCFIKMSAFVILGVLFFKEGTGGVTIGVLIAAAGLLLSWISSFISYGFGELIESNMIIAHSLRGNPSVVDIKTDERLHKLIELYAENLITEEEFVAKRKEILGE